VSEPGKQTICGFDISTYATAPDHFAIISEIVAYIQYIQKRYYPEGMLIASEIDSYIKKRAPQSQVTGDMVLSASGEYRIGKDGMPVLLALMQCDSMFGTKGEVARLHNPGNVGDNDRGDTIDFGTWQNGVMAVAEWLSRHRA
jgi:hypothetical protein